MNVQEQFGQIDIYVFDQILRGNIAPGMRILDAGCGYGRNLVHLLREGCEVFAVDANAEARRARACPGGGACAQLTCELTFA